MSRKAVRILLSCVVIFGSVGFLIAMTVQQSAAYYLHVDEVMANPEQWYGKPLQVHGFVDGEILKGHDTLDYRFQVKNGAAVLKATYTGVVPDTFKEGSEVVLKGRLAPDGFHVQSKDGVMAKCPSRYESKKK